MQDPRPDMILYQAPDEGFDLPTAIGRVTDVFSQKKSPATEVFSCRDALETTKRDAVLEPANVR